MTGDAEVTCPHCSAPSVKVIYMGAPMRLCQSEECSCVFGGLWWLLDLVPFNGWFMSYEGAYLPALWAWLTRSGDDE